MAIKLEEPREESSESQTRLFQDETLVVVDTEEGLRKLRAT
jgi:hypothetical protein